MEKLFQVFLVICAGLSVGIADALIKRVSFDTDSFWSAMRNPLMIPIALLYFAQIVLFTYVFIKRWELGIVGILQMAVYSIIVIGSGILLFQEKLTLVQSIGIGLAIIGAILMNL